jgi:type III secretion protein V
MKSSFKFSSFLLAVFVLAIAALFILPLPTILLDFLITLNLGIAFLVLLVALYMPNTLSLLAFPTLLLLTTLFRLGLNVASCRLILSQANAGEVIEAFGTFLIRGQIVVGLVIFSIITIVNYIVIAKGASRVSEVAARFALDAWPGRQMTIDSDLRAGLLSVDEAQTRREILRKESQLFGAMDGAMKFVQGDALAGIFIILTNSIGGLYVGLVNGMPIQEAVSTYLTLTVGDGLVSQIPAILVSICAGIVVTRVSSTEHSTLGQELGEQIFSQPLALNISGILLILLGLLMGLPWLPFVCVGGLLVVIALGPDRLRLRGFFKPEVEKRRGAESSPLALDSASESGQRTLELTYSRPLVVVLDAGVNFQTYEAQRDHYRTWWDELRNDIFLELGIRLPELTVVPDSDGIGGSFSIMVDGTAVERGVLSDEEILVEVNPESAHVFGLPVIREETFPLLGSRVFWTHADVNLIQVLDSAQVRYYDFLEFIFLKIGVFFTKNPEEIVSLTDIHYHLKDLDRRFPGIVAEALNKNLIDVPRLAEVAQELVREGLGIRDFKQLIEAVAGYCSNYRVILASGEDFDRNHLVSYIRIQRKRHVLSRFLSHRRTLKVCTLSEQVDEIFDQIPLDSHFAPLAVEPEVLESLLVGYQRLMEPVRRFGLTPVIILCRGELRSRIANFIRGTEVFGNVIAFDELDPSIEIEQVGIWVPS